MREAAKRILMLGLLMANSVTYAQNPSWTIESRPSTPDNKPKKPDGEPYTLGPVTKYSDAMGAKVIDRPTDEETAAAFGYSAVDGYKKKGTPSGTVSAGSAIDILAKAFPLAFPAENSPLVANSKCGGREFLYVQSVISSSGVLRVFGLRQTCAGECFASLDIQSGGVVASTSNEFKISGELCSRTIGDK